MGQNEQAPGTDTPNELDDYFADPEGWAEKHKNAA